MCVFLPHCIVLGSLRKLIINYHPDWLNCGFTPPAFALFKVKIGMQICRSMGLQGNSFCHQKPPGVAVHARIQGFFFG